MNKIIRRLFYLKKKETKTTLTNYLHMEIQLSDEKQITDANLCSAIEKWHEAQHAGKNMS